MKRVPALLLLFASSLFLSSGPVRAYTPPLRGRFEPVVADTDVSLYGIRMFSDGTVYLCGADGVFVESKDGGKTWKAREIESGVSFHVMSWWDGRTGFLAGRHKGKNVLLHTTDGGATFTAGAADVDFPVRGFAFVTGGSGWLVAGSGSEHEGAWRVTTDGGLTFHPPQAEEYRLPARDLRGVTSVDRRHLFAAGTHVEVSYVGPAARSRLYNRPRGAVLHSADRGATWEVLDAGNPVGTSLTAVDFIDEKTGWVVGEGGFAARTADGGKTWTKVDTGVTARLTAVDLVDAKTAFAVGGDGAAIGTSDGGETVSVLTTPDKPDLRACSFLSADTGYAVGRNGVVLRFVREW